MTEISLHGQRAVVTGASSGIGAATARELAAAGASVLLTYHSSAEDAEAVAIDARGSGASVHVVRADISDPADCARLFEEADRLLGGLDILVANAGVQEDAAFTELSLDDWRKVIDVNLTGQFLCAQEAVRRFRRQGGNEASAALGKIVFTSSVHQAIPWAGHANYAAAKGGLKLLMQSTAQLSAEKIRVNSVAPGAIKTDINHQDRHQQGRLAGRGGRRATPEADPVWACGRSRGRCPGDPVACLGRLGLRHRNDFVRGRRHDALPGVPRGWMIAGHNRRYLPRRDWA